MATRVCAVDFDRYRVQAVAILAQFRINAISALRAFAVFTLELVDGVGLIPNLVRNVVELVIEFGRFSLHFCEFAGKHDPQFCAHFVPKAQRNAQLLRPGASVSSSVG